MSSHEMTYNTVFCNIQPCRDISSTIDDNHHDHTYLVLTCNTDKDLCLGDNVVFTFDELYGFMSMLDCSVARVNSKPKTECQQYDEWIIDTPGTYFEL